MKNWWEEENQAVPAGPAGSRPWQLRLYVAGASARAAQAEANVRQCCETHLTGRYELAVVDLTQRPELAHEQQILALPLLVRCQPAPRQYLVGTLADEAQLLHHLVAGAAC